VAAASLNSTSTPAHGSAMNPMLRTTCTAALALTMLGALAYSPDARAGSIEYLTNQSADYIRTFSRNAAVDGPDIIAFNPAGTPFLKDGIHFGLSNQTLLGEYAIEYKDKKYTADVMVPALPSLFAAWKKGDLAIFGAFTVPAGGGSLEYSDGIPYLIPLYSFVDKPDGNEPTNGVFAGSVVFYGGTLGAAYKLFDMISLSIAGRVPMADKQFDGHATYGTKKAELHTNKAATGFNVIAGLTVRPGFGLTLGARYETKTAMEFTAKTSTNNLTAMDSWKNLPLESFADGAKEQRDMPAVLGIGLAWESPFGLTLSTSYHSYDTAGADSDKDNPGNEIPGVGALGAYVKSWDDDYNSSWDLAFAAEYKVTDKLLVSVGYIRAVMGGNKDTYSDFEFALDSNSIGGGARYMVTDTLAVTLGVSKTMYEDGKNENLAVLVAEGPETFSKSVMDIALGVAYRL